MKTTSKIATIDGGTEGDARRLAAGYAADDLEGPSRDAWYALQGDSPYAVEYRRHLTPEQLKRCMGPYVPPVRS